MLEHLRDSLLALQQNDLSVRAELEADGSLFDGYHPRMAAVHRDNARALCNVMDEFGWPHEGLVGEEGAEAAWLVLQHAIAEPDVMRRGRDLLAAEVAAGRVPRWQFAYLDDRIRVFEGRPQRFGTQMAITPDGPVVCEVDEPAQLEKRRQQAGLSLLAQRLKDMDSAPRPSQAEYQARKSEEAAWRIQVGWVAARLNPDDQR